MSQQAHEAARRIVAEVFGAEQGGDPGAAAREGAVPPATDTVEVADRSDQRPTARRAREIVAAVFDPPAATPVAGPASEPGPGADPGPAPAPPTAALRRARELVEEAAAAQASRARRRPEEPVAPPERQQAPAPAPPDPPADGARVALFAAQEPEEPAQDRLFARTDSPADTPADTQEEPLPEQQDLPPSLAEDVEGPPPPPPLPAEPPAVVDQPAPPAQVAEPPRADLAARLVSQVLQERGRSDAAAAPAPPAPPQATPDDEVTQQLLEEEPRGVARWLLVTAIGAVTLALLLPLAVAAVRELLALS